MSHVKEIRGAVSILRNPNGISTNFFVAIKFSTCWKFGNERECDNNGRLLSLADLLSPKFCLYHPSEDLIILNDTIICVCFPFFTFIYLFRTLRLSWMTRLNVSLETGLGTCLTWLCGCLSGTVLADLDPLELSPWSLTVALSSLLDPESMVSLVFLVDIFCLVLPPLKLLFPFTFFF